MTSWFDKVSQLTAHLNFKMKHSILINIDDQDKSVKTNNENVKDTYKCFKKPSDEDDFEHEILEDILKDEPYENEKVETPMLNLLSKTLQQLTSKSKKKLMIFYN